MNALKKLAVVFGRLWAPVLIMLIVLACGLLVQETPLAPELHPAHSAALQFGPVI
jgi:hypothetical protein